MKIRRLEVENKHKRITPPLDELGEIRGISISKTTTAKSCNRHRNCIIGRHLIKSNLKFGGGGGGWGVGWIQHIQKPSTDTWKSNTENVARPWRDVLSPRSCNT